MTVSEKQAERGGCGYFFKRKWHLMGSPEIPLLVFRENLVLTRARIYVFWGLLVAWRVCFLKFQMYRAVFHSFLNSADIHLTPKHPPLGISGRNFALLPSLGI